MTKRLMFPAILPGILYPFRAGGIQELPRGVVLEKDPVIESLRKEAGFRKIIEDLNKQIPDARRLP